MAWTSFRSKTGMPSAAMRDELRSELDTAPRKRCLCGARASMKRSTVEPVPTPSTVEGVSSGRTNSMAAAATFCLSCVWVSMNEACLAGESLGVFFFGKPDAHATVGIDGDRPPDQRGKLRDQGQPLFGRGRRLAVVRKIAPGHG